MAIGVSNYMYELTQAVGREAASIHYGATAMLADRQLVFGLVARAHRTSHPPHTITWKVIELWFIAPGNFGPLITCPIKVKVCPIHSELAIFSLFRGFLTGRHPLSSAACKRRRKVSNEGAGSFCDQTTALIYVVVRLGSSRNTRMMFRMKLPWVCCA